MKRKGVTLIELIIVMAIMAILITITTQVLFSTGVVFKRTNDSANIQNQSLVLSRIVTDDLKYGTEVAILSSTPTTFDESINYIYEKDGEILLKAPHLGPKVLSNTQGIAQKVTFTKLRDNSISVGIELLKGSTAYENQSVVTFLNLDKDKVVNGTTGNCISFKTEKKLLEEIQPEIISFDLLATENSVLEKDYKSENIGETGIIINNVSNVITVNSELILITNTKNAFLVPKIVYKGDNLKVKIGSTIKDFDVTIGESIDFYNNDVSLIVENYTGLSKEYKVDIKTKVYPIINNLQILSQNTSSQNGAIIPAVNDVLNAKFDVTFVPDKYLVRWYAVNVKDASSVNEIYTNYQNGAYLPYKVIENSTVLDVKDFGAEASKYVMFYDVVPVIIDGTQGDAQGKPVCTLSIN